MGWENVGTKDDPVYKLLDCKKELSNLGNVDYKGELNTTGDCAQGLNNMFLR